MSAADLPPLTRATAHLHGLTYLGPDGDGRAMYGHLDACPPGCTSTSRPYCHCQACGAPGVQLDESGYCASCLDEKGFES